MVNDNSIAKLPDLIQPETITPAKALFNPAGGFNLSA